MTLTEKVVARYANAQAELEAMKVAGPQTPQQRYDYRKAVRRNGGRPPSRQVVGIIKMQKELAIEELYVLRGIQDALTELTLANYDVKEVIGDVAKAIEEAKERQAR